MGKVLAVGDIHTKVWIIKAVEKIIDNYDAVVFVGDYADDWGKTPLDTLDTWKNLRALQKKHPNKVSAVLGNHDYIYLNYTKTISGGYNPSTQILLDVPESKELKDWLRTIKISEKIDSVVYSHAGFVEEWKTNDYWDDLSCIWVRPYDEVNYNVNFPHSGQVFGHTPSKTCWEVQPNVWCIDTFSTYPDGSPIGDGTVLEITDGKTFEKIKLEK